MSDMKARLLRLGDAHRRVHTAGDDLPRTVEQMSGTGRVHRVSPDGAHAPV
jgi:hypothetical protein